jgi:hypothetical protein
VAQADGRLARVGTQAVVRGQKVENWLRIMALKFNA